MEQDTFVIRDLEHLVTQWTRTYNTGGKPDWSHILPYYHQEVHFRDSIQEIRGFDDFQAMVERLTRRSSELGFKIVRAVMEGRTIFLEWEMTILFRKTRTSVLYGASRLTLDERGKIIEQRDYYDIWGDILDNIPWVGKVYRKFVKKVLG